MALGSSLRKLGSEVGEFLIGSDERVDSRSLLTGEQQGLLQFLAKYLRGTPIEELGQPFEGDFVAGMTGREGDLLSQLTGQAQGGLLSGGQDRQLQDLINTLTGNQARDPNMVQGPGFGTTGPGVILNPDGSTTTRAAGGMGSEFENIPTRPGRETADINQLLTSFGENPLIARMLEGNPQGFEEFYRTNISQPAIREFQEEILPGLDRRFAGQSFSTDRGTVAQRATDDLSENLLASRSKLAFDTQQQALDRAMQALGMSGQLATSQGQLSEQARQANISDTNQALDRLLRSRTTSEQLGLERQGLGLQGLGLQADISQREQANLREALDAASLPRDIENQRLQAEYQDFLRGIGQRSDRVNQILGAIGLRGRENIVWPGSEGAVQGFLDSLGASMANSSSGAGGGGGMASMFASMFSSRDYKENIEPVTKESLRNAIMESKIHTYNYKPEMKIPGRQIGLIAEDAPELFANPDRKSVNGYNMISALLSNVQDLNEEVAELRSRA